MFESESVFVDPVSVEVAFGLFPMTATSAVQCLMVGVVEGTVSGVVCFSLRPSLLRRAALCFDCYGTFSAPPSRPNQEGRRVDAGTREAERCTGVTNAVVGEADGAAVLAELTAPLVGGKAEVVRLRTGNRRSGL